MVEHGGRNRKKPISQKGHQAVEKKIKEFPEKENLSCEFVFGPVPSRRLGRSLGIDLVPFKTCTYDCIYCQLGRTSRQTIERKAYVPGKKVIEDFEEKLSSLSSPPDYITFSGSGEPTLNSEIGEVINVIKGLTKIPIAVLTNGSLLHLKTVRKALLNADVVIPSLDAATPQLWKFINRPHHSLRLSQILSGLKDFRQEFAGQIWLEVMMCAGINDGPREIKRLKEAIEWIDPDRVQLNTVIRPPAEEFAHSLPLNGLRKVKNLLGEEVEIISEFKRGDENISEHIKEEEVINLLKRRPCTAEEISKALGYRLSSLYRSLKKLRDNQIIRYQLFSGRGYYELNWPAAKLGSEKILAKMD